MVGFSIFRAYSVRRARAAQRVEARDRVLTWWGYYKGAPSHARGDQSPGSGGSRNEGHHCFRRCVLSLSGARSDAPSGISRLGLLTFSQHATPVRKLRVLARGLRARRHSWGSGPAGGRPVRRENIRDNCPSGTSRHPERFLTGRHQPAQLREQRAWRVLEPRRSERTRPGRG